MPEIQIHIPAQQPELEVAITQFIEEEFKQKVTFKEEPISDEIQKGNIVDIVWQGIVFITVVESTLQFAERLKRMERVKKLLEAIKKSGKAVYLKIGKNGETVDLSKKSVDEAMDLLTKKDKEE